MPHSCANRGRSVGDLVDTDRPFLFFLIVFHSPVSLLTYSFIFHYEHLRV